MVSVQEVVLLAIFQGTGAVLGTTKVSLTNEKALSGMHDHQCIRFCRDMVDKVSLSIHEQCLKNRFRCANKTYETASF